MHLQCCYELYSYYSLHVLALSEMAASVYLLFIISFCLLQWSCGNALAPVVYPAKSLPSSSQCGNNPFGYDVQLMETLKMIHQQLLPPGCNPPATCRDVHRCNSSTSSGYYQVQAANGSAIEVYCDMEGIHCGGEGGWMRVAYLNMTDPSTQCPAGYKLETINNTRFCIRNAPNNGQCGPSTLFEPFGLTYSQVCGYVRGYSYHGTDAFFNRSPQLDDPYVDGISITYVTPLTHIWTYAAGFQETMNTHSNNCPCNTAPGPNPASPDVGSDYYCESGSFGDPAPDPPRWFTDDPLWDGMQCGGDEGPCCNHTGLPWFIKKFPTPTIATIEVRLCMDTSDTSGADENIGIERLELYIK